MLKKFYQMANTPINDLNCFRVFGFLILIMESHVFDVGAITFAITVQSNGINCCVESSPL